MDGRGMKVVIKRKVVEGVERDEAMGTLLSPSIANLYSRRPVVGSMGFKHAAKRTGSAFLNTVRDVMALSGRHLGFASHPLCPLGPFRARTCHKR